MNATVIAPERKTHHTFGETWHEHFIRIQLPNGAEGTIDYCDRPGDVPRYWATYQPAWMKGGWWEYRTDDWQEAKRYALTAYAGVDKQAA